MIGNHLIIGVCIPNATNPVGGLLRSTQHPLPSGFGSSSTAQEVTGVDFEDPNFGADISPVSETTDPTARGVRPSAVDADAAQKLTRLSETVTSARIGD